MNSLDGVALRGKITYERVFFDATGAGLDYSTRTPMPARGIRVELFDETDELLVSGFTDEQGDYFFNLPDPANVRVVASARLVAADIRVTDNTDGNSLYQLQGSLAPTGNGSSTRNLHASIGWGTDAFLTDRAAAPFAILDTVYEGIERLEEATGGNLSIVDMPDLELRWSVNNRPTTGERTLEDLRNGDIGTSFFSRGQGVIYILGAASNDTDEFDQHLVMHEWFHYLQQNFSRSDSMGGNHSLNDRLDLRLAFGEGAANAMSGILLEDPYYRDSSGSNQADEFSFSMEGDFFSNRGWFSESTVQELIYDIYDQNPDGADNIELGLLPVWQTLVSSTFTAQPSLTSIYSFLETLNVPLADQAGLLNLVAANQIAGQGIWGTGETNDGGIEEALPVYLDLAVGETREVCVDNSAGHPNKLGNRRLIRINNPSGARLSISANTSLAQQTDPDMKLWSNGVCRAWAISPDDDSETLVMEEEGTLVLEFEDWLLLNPDEVDPPAAGPTCFDIRIVESPSALLSGPCNVFPAASTKTVLPQVFKPGAAVNLEIQGNTGLVPGVAKSIRIRLVHQYHQGRASLDLDSPDGIQLSRVQWSGDLAGSPVLDIPIEVLAATPGRHYLAVNVSIEQGGRVERRAFAIPLEVGNATAPGQRKTGDSNSPQNPGVHALPVQESIDQ